MVAIMTAELTACQKTQGECEKQTLALLEEKYNEEFVVEKYCGQEYLEGYYTTICYPQKAPDILFEVKTAFDGGEIQDAYVSASVCRKAEEQIDSNLEHLDGYLLEKVVPVSRNVDSENADMSMDEFMTLKSKNRFAVYLMYCPQEKNVVKVYREIQDTFVGLECMSGNIQFYILQEEELKEVQAYLAETAEPDYEFEEMTRDMKRITIPFNNGVITMPEENFAEKAGGLV